VAPFVIQRPKVFRLRGWQGVIALLLGTLLGALLALWPSAHAIDDSPDKPAVNRRVQDQPSTCLFGVYIQDMRDYQFAQNSFFASIRLWSVCPTSKQSPLSDFNVLNANSINLGKIYTEKVPNQSDYFRNDPEVYWSTRTVDGRFYHRWSAKNFPFDRHTIVLEFEVLKDDINSFVLTPDFTHSGFNSMISNDDWIANNFSIKEVPQYYSTNFGKPDLSASREGSYSRVKVQLTLQRTRITSFLKLCTGVYAAVLMSGMAFILDSRDSTFVSSRNGILVGCLFASIVSMQKAEATLGASEDVTLTDSIHIVSICYILAASILGFMAYLWCQAGRGEQVLRLNRKIILPTYIISYAVINSLLIAYAAIIG
jgi:hypothetical protein